MTDAPAQIKIPAKMRDAACGAAPACNALGEGVEAHRSGQCVAVTLAPSFSARMYAFCPENSPPPPPSFHSRCSTSTSFLISSRHRSTYTPQSPPLLRVGYGHNTPLTICREWGGIPPPARRSRGRRRCLAAGHLPGGRTEQEDADLRALQAGSEDPGGQAGSGGQQHVRLAPPISRALLG